MSNVEGLTEEALIQLYEGIKDFENLNDYEREFITEQERRGAKM